MKKTEIGYHRILLFKCSQFLWREKENNIKQVRYWHKEPSKKSPMKFTGNWLSHNSVYSSMFYYIFDGLRYQCLVVLSFYSVYAMCWSWCCKDFQITEIQSFQVTPTLHLPMSRLQSKESECARLSHLNNLRYWNQSTSLLLDLTWPSASESPKWLGSICVWSKSGSKIVAQRRDACLRRVRILGQTSWKNSPKGAACLWICPPLLLLRHPQGFKFPTRSPLRMTR